MTTATAFSPSACLPIKAIIFKEDFFKLLKLMKSCHEISNTYLRIYFGLMLAQTVTKRYNILGPFWEDFELHARMR